MREILLISGREVDPFTMHLADIDVMDIAHSLSMQCRYAGHVPSFYSVAEHCCVAVQLMANERGLNIDTLRGDKLARSILMHDADEAYLQDLVSPVKNRDSMESYRAAGDRLHSLVAHKFECLQLTAGHQHDPEVREYDRKAYEWERENIRTGQLEGLSPADAKRAFLGMWYIVRPSTYG